MRVESMKPSANKLGGWIHRLAEPRPVFVPVKRERPVVDWGAEARRLYKAGAARRQAIADELGVKVEALEELMVGAGHDNYRGLYFTSWPERNAAGVVVGIVRRYRDGSKKTMSGSHHGLYYGRRPFVMPGPVLLPEGGSDTAALLGLGINVVGRPSNTGGIADLLTLLAPVRTPIVVLGERDKKQIAECSCGTCMRCWPGLAGAVLTAERLRAGLKRPVLIRILRGAKDAREWVKIRSEASAIDVINSVYIPDRDSCRVCGNAAPHEERLVKNRIEIVCRECRALLENKRA